MEHFQQRLVELGKKYQRSVPLDVPAEASILDSLLIPSQGIVFRALIQQGQLSVLSIFRAIPSHKHFQEWLSTFSERGNFLRH